MCVNGECEPGLPYCKQPCPSGWSGALCSLPAGGHADDSGYFGKSKDRGENEIGHGTIMIDKVTGETTELKDGKDHYANGAVRSNDAGSHRVDIGRGKDDDSHTAHLETTDRNSVKFDTKKESVSSSSFGGNSVKIETS